MIVELFRIDGKVHMSLMIFSEIDLIIQLNAKDYICEHKFHKPLTQPLAIHTEDKSVNKVHISVMPKTEIYEHKVYKPLIWNDKDKICEDETISMIFNEVH